MYQISEILKLFQQITSKIFLSVLKQTFLLNEICEKIIMLFQLCVTFSLLIKKNIDTSQLTQLGFYSADNDFSFSRQSILPTPIAFMFSHVTRFGHQNISRQNVCRVLNVPAKSGLLLNSSINIRIQPRYPIPL